MAISNMSATFQYAFNMPIYEEAITGLNPRRAPQSLQDTLSWTTFGAGAGAANEMYISNSASLAASGTVELNVYNGLTDPLGNTITFARIKMVFVRHKASSSSSGLKVGTTASGNTFTGFWANASDGVILAPGQMFMWGGQDATGVIPDATHKQLLFTNNDGSNGADYQIIILGATS